MTKDILRVEPARFDLASFADLLPAREHIPGEDPGSFQGFHEGMMRSLVPMTPYEGVIAENLISIEWELLQHQRMREACLRGLISAAISEAAVAKYKDENETALEEA